MKYKTLLQKRYLDRPLELRRQGYCFEEISKNFSIGHQLRAKRMPTVFTLFFGDEDRKLMPPSSHQSKEVHRRKSQKTSTGFYHLPTNICPPDTKQALLTQPGASEELVILFPRVRPMRWDLFLPETVGDILRRTVGLYAVQVLVGILGIQWTAFRNIGTELEIIK